MRFSVLLLLLLSYYTALAQPPKPATATWIVDRADILSSSEEDFLREEIAYLEAQSSVELVIATVPSLQGANLERYAQDWAESWGIGKAEKDNGLLLLVALQDRKMRLQVGYGLEARITDLESKQLLDYNLKPNFRREAYFEGFQAFLSDLFGQLQVAPSPALRSAQGEEPVPIAARDSSGQIIRPLGVPDFMPPSVWDPDTLMSDSIMQIIDRGLERQANSYSGKSIWLVFLKKLPPSYASLRQYVDSLQAGWMVAYPSANRQALVVYHAGLDSFTYRASEDAFFESKIQQAYTRVLEPLRPLGESRALAWSMDYLLDALRGDKFGMRYMEQQVFRLSQPEAYAQEQARQAEIDAFDYWLNRGQWFALFLAPLFLFFYVAKMRSKGYARRLAARLSQWIRRIYILLFIARLIGCIVHPEPFVDILFAHLLFEIVLLLMVLMFSFGMLTKGLGGGSGGGFSSGSFGGSSSSSSFGGGSFGGGGASSSW